MYINILQGVVCEKFYNNNIKMDKNIPNYLTIMRIIIIPIIVMSFYVEDSWLAHVTAATLFALASITDFFDGYIARKFNLVSNMGTMLDPIADKVLVGCVILMIVSHNRADEIPCLLILARELTVAGLREFLAQVHVSVPVTKLTKIKTFIQMLALTLILLGSTGSLIPALDIIAHITLWLAAILTLVTGVSYLKASSRYW